MNMNNEHPGLSGGFSRPEFTPGPGAQTPRVNADIAAVNGTDMDRAEAEGSRHEERQEVERKRRWQLIGVVASILVVIAIIVAGMIWFWANDPYLVDAMAISTA